MNINENLPCRATFKIGCVINVPLKNDKWMIGGTYNDNFMCDLVSDATNLKELLLEVIQIIDNFKNGLNNVVTLDSMLKNAINNDQVNVEE